MREDWTPAGKKIARRAYEAAREVVLARTLGEFKGRAAAASTIGDMWLIRDWMQERGRELDDLLDYRYSQLIGVFARLIAQGYLDEKQLAGLSEGKLAQIKLIVTVMRGDC